MALDDIYTELIAEESRNPEHRHHLEAPTVRLRGHNPSCGDEITLELATADGLIADAAFMGVGCAISQAATSMMIDLIKGKPVDEALSLAKLFVGMVTGEVADDAALAPLEDSAALASVRQLPARVKCAALPWHTLENALRERS